MGARIVRYIVEADGHIEVLIPYKLYQDVLRFMRGHHVQATADEVVADAVRAYLRGRVRRSLTG
jgi:hypothetical protein